MLAKCLSPDDKIAMSSEIDAAKLIEHLQGPVMPEEDIGHKPMLKIFMKDESVEVPKYEKEGDSGLDLRATEDVEMMPLSRALIPTGVVIELPPGHEGQVRPRSGLAAKHGITVLNTPGTVDNGYRSEIKVILFNTSRETFMVEKGMRIAQLVIAPVATVAVFKVSSEEALTSTERGAGGFGSTGQN